MGQIPDETAGLINAPTPSGDGDQVSISFIGFWTHRSNPPPRTTVMRDQLKRMKTA